MKRLDHGLCNSYWRNFFPNATVTHLPGTRFDHAPILLSYDSPVSQTFVKPFRFEMAWLSHPEVASSAWESNSLLLVITNFTLLVKDWDKSIFGNAFIRKKWLLARILGIQNFPHYPTSQTLLNLESSLQIDLDLVY